MKGIRLVSFAGEERLDFASLEDPEPEEGEVLVKVMASPINPSDLIFISGANPTPRPLPSVPGFEGSGLVVGSGGGPEADALKGKRVCFRAKPADNGAWAEFAVTDASRCLPLMDHVSYEQGAMLLVNPLTAWALLEAASGCGFRAAIQTAAASALGKMVIKLAERRQFPLINVVRRAEQAEILKNAGANNVLDSSAADFAERLTALAHKLQAQVAFDAVAGDMSNTILKAMPAESELWVYGGLSGEPCKVDPISLIYLNKALRGFWGPPWVYKQGQAVLALAMVEIQKNVESVFKTTVRKIYPPEAFADALQDYRTNMTAGKILFTFARP